MRRAGYGARAHGGTEFWLNLQRAVDLWDARAAVKDDMRRIKPLCIA